MASLFFLSPLDVFLSFVFIVNITGRGQNAFYTECPDAFVEGVNPIMCTIDTTLLGGCTLLGSLVRFRFTPNGGGADFLCATPFNAASCDTTLNAAGCACMNHFLNNTQTYKYNFNFSEEAHAGGAIDCLVSCFGPPPSSGQAQSCRSLQLRTSTTTGMTLSPCGSDKTVELEETRVDNTITCSGIPDDFVVDWLLTLPTRPESVNVGNCNVGSTTCSDLSAIGYLATRPSANTSVLTINHRTRVEFVRNGTLECKASKAGHSNQRDGCLLDIIYPSEATCDAQYNTGSPQWTVSGSCTITKASSERGRYNCSWLYTHNSKGAIQIAYDQTSNSSISRIPGSNATHPYFSFTCNFSMPFPSVAGTYGYSTVLYPGNVKKPATFSGSSVVVDPTTPSHDCPPGVVIEGTTITCSCTITSLGTPPGTLAWKGQSGPHLHLINVRLSQNNQLYTCELRRGTMVVKETKYTLKVAGRLRGPSVQRRLRVRAGGGGVVRERVR